MIQSPELRVVEASAGSGKTFALAKRYVQLMLIGGIAGSNSIRQILAITFTNKAAFEMKARILDFLKRIALDLLSPDEQKEIVEPLKIDKKTVRENAHRIMDEIILNYNFFQVQTIDSFINALLSGCAFKIGLSARFKIRHDAFEYMCYSLDRLIDRAGSDARISGLFENFLRQYLFLENKSSWFPKKDIQGLLFALYQQSNIYAKDFFIFPLSEDLLTMKAKTFEKFKRLRAQCPEGGTDGRFLKSFDSFIGKYHRGFDFDSLPDYFSRLEFPIRSGADLPRAVQDAWEDLREDLRAVSEAEACASFNPYLEIFYNVLAEFKEAARQDDVLFLEELNKKAHMLFEEEGITAGELYYRLATRFRHYLIDEFQDTSLLQWQNLSAMAEEALSTGGTVFYVGDKKQAIYGFRGGEVRLFDEVKESLRQFNVQEEVLKTNYRSFQTLVDFNNQVFSLANLERFVRDKQTHEEEKKKKDIVHFTAEDFTRLGSLFGHSQQETLPQKKGGHVRVRYVAGTVLAERQEQVREDLLRQIQDLSRRYAYGQIAILTRDNNDVETVTSWLSEEGIAVESERTLNIKEHFIVQQLVLFLKFLNSPSDNIAFSSFVMGDVFCRAVNMSTDEMRDFLFSLRSSMRRDGSFYVYMAFRQQYPQLWQAAVEAYFKRAGFYPVYELVISMIEGFKIFEHFADQQGFVMQFLEMIKRYESEASDLTAFLEYYEANEHEHLYVNVAGSDSIRVMTIHKAKGLEFPVVLLPFFEMSVRVGQTSGSSLGQRAFIVDARAEKLGLYRIKSKYLKFSQHLEEVRAREYIDSFFSELNNAYVALTRAVEEMFIWIPERSGSSINIASFLISQECYDRGAPLRQEKEQRPKKRSEMEYVVLSPPVYRDWIKFLEYEFEADSQSIKNRASIRQGNILHALLQNLESVGGQPVDERLQGALCVVRGKFPMVHDFSEHLNIVKALLLREDCADLFSVKEGEILCEQEIVDEFGRIHRMDRLIVEEGRVRVVDYKMSAAQQESHIKQIGVYMDLLKKMFPGRTIEGVLLYLDSFSKVVVQES